jgi:hypothetical protein
LKVPAEEEQTSTLGNVSFIDVKRWTDEKVLFGIFLFIPL